eukprot:scaffold83142_cov19-Tisochrysis_lutea.AAC.1
MSEPFLHLSRAAFTIVRKGWPGWTRGCMHPVLQLWGLPENAQHDPGQPAEAYTVWSCLVERQVVMSPIASGDLPPRSFNLAFDPL